MTVESVVLRAAVGDDTYGHICAIATELDALEHRGVISRQGLSTIIETIADEMITQSLARELMSHSTGEAVLSDAPTPEDPRT